MIGRAGGLILSLLHFQDPFPDDMYSLDNDSFLNSLEAMAVNWPDYGTGPGGGGGGGGRSNNDSDV